MAPSSSAVDVYLEIGKKRTFAGAIEWPGWCRSGRDEDAALQALFDYGPRYAQVLRPAQFGFQPPVHASQLNATDRVEGNATTDFGAPAIAPANDQRPVDEIELQRLQDLLKACWKSFDKIAADAYGKHLRKGPRGGGRELDGIIRHVLGGEAGYLAQLGGKYKINEEDDPQVELSRLREDILKTLASAARGDLPERGPRGGLHWSPRYFVRRAAWHVLDHAWEIEDRALASSPEVNQ